MHIEGGVGHRDDGVAQQIAAAQLVEGVEGLIAHRRGQLAYVEELVVLVVDVHVQLALGQDDALVLGAACGVGHGTVVDWLTGRSQIVLVVVQENVLTQAVHCCPGGEPGDNVLWYTENFRSLFKSQGTMKGEECGSLLYCGTEIFFFC